MSGGGRSFNFEGLFPQESFCEESKEIRGGIILAVKSDVLPTELDAKLDFITFFGMF